MTLTDITLIALPIIYFLALYLSKKYKDKKFFIFLHQYRGPIITFIPLIFAGYFLVTEGEYNTLLDIFLLMSIVGVFYWVHDIRQRSNSK